MARGNVPRKRKWARLSAWIAVALLFFVASNLRMQYLFSPTVDETALISTIAGLPIIGWNTLNQTGYSSDDRVMVLVTHSERSSSYNELEATVRDSLSSPQTLLFVYSTSQQSLRRLERRFRDFSSRSRLILRLAEAMDETEFGWDLVEDLNLAYLLEFTADHATMAKYTLVLNAGMRFALKTGSTFQNFAPSAIKNHTLSTRFRKICWTTLSDTNDNSNDTVPAILFETAHHARRMALMLRSALPYRVLRAREILNLYCSWFIVGGSELPGPRLFMDATSRQARPMSKRSKLEPIAFINASELPTPPWIDPTVAVGPIIYGNGKGPTFSIVFGVPTIPRPNNMTVYLEQFMSEMIQVVETDFMHQSTSDRSSTGTITTTSKSASYQAFILLLISGNSLEEIAAHRLFLETTYQNAIARGIVRLVDAPIQSYPLGNLRVTNIDDSPERRYWRCKQNLDVAATLQAAAGTSEYVMLLEDDVGYQPDFGSHLKEYMTKSSRNGGDPRYGIPSWSVSEWGFGYAGLLLHSSDVHVFQRLHWSLYDERPCDLFQFYQLVRRADRRQPRSPFNFTNGTDLYLKHYGKVSSLAGKSQDVFRR